MWYIDWDQCTPPLRAFYAAGGGAPSDDPCGIPCASDQERAMLEPLRPVYDGTVRQWPGCRSLSSLMSASTAREKVRASIPC